jgi:hypothetical protein
MSYSVKIIDGVPTKIVKLVVHSFTVGDSEDPIIHAAQPMHEWENTECGQWVKQHAIEIPMWHQQIDHMRMGYRFAITAELSEKDAIYFNLKWK